jgi:alpha-beta hydrolase superfamily lysophospholipase
MAGLRLVSRLVGLAALIVLGVLLVRAVDSQRGPPLSLWHTFHPHELSGEALERADWSSYLAAEDRLLASVRHEVTEKLAPDERVAINRYFDGSLVYPAHFERDWNRSFVLEPDAVAQGAVVLLHGLTDSPYSLRHIAKLYRDHGYLALAIRLPGHGSVPGGLAEVDFPDWLAATRLAVREARRRVGPSVPLHIVGYSNGGALALMYGLEALDDVALPAPTRIILMSPMIGITRFARFAGLAGLPAFFPRFARAAWLSVLPEFNPFKYNSFPVNGARQSYRLTQALQRALTAHAKAGQLAALAPILTFQSLIDSTVSTKAVISDFYELLPDKGSEFVLFDLNRSAKLGPLLRPEADTLVTRLMPDPPRSYKTAIVTNASPETPEMVERVTEAGSLTTLDRPLGLRYPADVYALSHVALPFPLEDGLYGTKPDPNDHFGLNLGAIALRGERGALIIGPNELSRMMANPFFAYMAERIVERLEHDRGKP